MIKDEHLHILDFFLAAVKEKTEKLQLVGADTVRAIAFGRVTNEGWGGGSSF